MICSGYFMDISNISQELYSSREKSKVFLREIQGTSTKKPRKFQDMSDKHLENMRDGSGKNSEHVLEMSMRFHGHLQHNSEGFPGNIQEIPECPIMFQDMSMPTPRFFLERSGNSEQCFQANSEELPRNL